MYRLSHESNVQTKGRSFVGGAGVAVVVVMLEVLVTVVEVGGVLELTAAALALVFALALGRLARTRLTGVAG